MTFPPRATAARMRSGLPTAHMDSIKWLASPSQWNSGTPDPDWVNLKSLSTVTR